ncbi:uncharacterized protein K460DRAFT_383614 [Cucurbitaria berberidis CBS 394.84]|uniref:Uncharacterized protein n=1 Tax=Cucurbitaria berberidis CBS 394.84 TaxID=1168544 RepID=A0A9P4LAE4_9PLEO|nr:uncharacterized protein K460DRAFT_383614 [Cucurbitaria berberidis CBS 394.84]KAF1847114.1 hypothetical protein K460DRAFT_383614 [Cucurbitaria berberidis CBS 394.84]
MGRARKRDSSVPMLLIILLMILRFVLFAPSGYYRAIAKNHDRVIQRHIELHNGTYSMAITTGEKIAGKWASIAFFWNIALWVPSLVFFPPLNAPFMVMDSVITGYLSRATSYQTSYSPHNKRLCNPDHNPNFHDLLRPAGVNESFFEAASRLNSTVTTPKQMCESFVQEWQYGITLSFFFALISLLNITAFLCAIKQATIEGKTFYQKFLTLYSPIYRVLRYVPTALLMLVTGILYGLPECILRCLPACIRRPMRHGRRYALKAGLGVGQKMEMQMTELKTEFMHARGPEINKARYTGGGGKQSPLSEFLSIYDLLMLVAEQLHYLDVVNLSRVSKSVRESVLPAHDFDRRMHVFRTYTCEPSEKSTCWTCSNQICSSEDCAQPQLIPQTTLLHHLDCCKPYCTSCYKAHLLRSPKSSRGEPYCRCAPVPANPNLYLRLLNGTTYYVNQQTKLPRVMRPVCRECNLHGDVKLLKIGEKRAKLQLKQGLQETGKEWTMCARVGCGGSLGIGPRWWICSKSWCGKECKSLLHGAWGRTREEGGKDGAVVVGEQAV